MLSQVIGLFLAASEFSLCDYLLIQAWRVTDLSKKWCLTLENHQFFFSTSCPTKKQIQMIYVSLFYFSTEKGTPCMKNFYMNLQLEERHSRIIATEVRDNALLVLELSS